MEIDFTLSEMLNRLVNDAGMQALVVGVLLRVVLGMASAWTRGDFAIKKVGDFLARIALPYGATYAAFVALGDAAGDLKVFGPSVLAALEVMNLAAITESLAEMGVPMPDKLLNAAAGAARASQIREDLSKRAQK